MSAPTSSSDPSPLKEAGCQKLSGLGGQKCLGRSGDISTHAAFNTSPPNQRGQPPITARPKSAAAHSWQKCMWEGVIIFLSEFKAWTGLMIDRFSFLQLSSKQGSTMLLFAEGQEVSVAQVNCGLLLFSACFPPDVLKDQQVSLRSSP